MPDIETPGVVTLVMEDPHGQRHTVVLSGPGGTIRIAVGRPGRRSAVWRIWAIKTKPDVYVAARSIAGVQKFSLHASGDWRNQWVSRNHALKFTEKEDRLLDRWPRPPEGLGGWTKGVSIWVPQRDVVDVQDDDQRLADVTWVPEPPPGRVIGLHVIVARTDQGFVPVKGAVPVDGFTLINGEVVLVLVSRSELTPDKNAWLDAQRTRALEASQHVDISNAKAPRMSLFGFDDAGGRIVWDLAVQPNS